MRYKKWGFVSLAICLGLLLNSCSSKTNSNIIKTKSDLHGSVSLWSDESSLKAIQNVEENYKKTQPDVKLDIQNLNSNDSIIERISKTSTSTSERPDAAVIEEESVPLLINTFPNDFEDLTKYFSDKTGSFTNNSISGVTYNGKVWAYPWYDYPAAIFYRKDILSKYGINIEDIKTWNDLIQAGRKINKDSSQKIKMLSVNDNSDDLFRVMLNELGGTYRDKNGSCILNDEKSTRVMAMLKSLKDENIINEVNGNDEIWNALKSGSTAGIILPFQDISDLISRLPELKGMLQMNYLPSFDIGGNKAASFGGKSIMIFKNNKNDKIINDFVNYAVSDKKMVVNNLKDNNIFTGYIPAYRDNYYESNNNFFSNQKILKMFININNDTYNIGFTPDYKNLNQNIVEAQKKILSGEDIANVMQQLVIKGGNK